MRPFTTIHEKEISRSTIVFTKYTIEWCKIPYRNNPDGCPNCPNCKSCETCPPNAPYRPDIIETYKHFYLIYARFDRPKYMVLFSKEWQDGHKEVPTELQASCLLYWQNSVRKVLMKRIEEIYSTNKKIIRNIELFGCGSGLKSKIIKQDPIYSMEASGMFVLATLHRNHVPFAVPRRHYINDKLTIVSLLCSRENVDFSPPPKITQKTIF